VPVIIPLFNRVAVPDVVDFKIMDPDSKTSVQLFVVAHLFYTRLLALYFVGYM
jgi:hypothetical protein